MQVDAIADTLIAARIAQFSAHQALAENVLQDDAIAETRLAASNAQGSADQALAENVLQDDAIAETRIAASNAQGSADQALAQNVRQDAAIAENRVAADQALANTRYVRVNSTGAAPTATGTDAIAIGESAIASADQSMAMGRRAQASGNNAVAIGNGATASAAGAVAIGPGAVADEENLIVVGDTYHRYRAPGINSSASRAAQEGALSLVTTDAMGNLGTVGFDALALEQYDQRLSTLETRTSILESEVVNNILQTEGGIAAAMAMSGTMIVPDSDVSLSLNLSTYRGQQGFSGAVVGRVFDRVYVSGGIAGSTVSGTTGGRVSVANVY